MLLGKLDVFEVVRFDLEDFVSLDWLSSDLLVELVFLVLRVVQLLSKQLHVFGVVVRVLGLVRPLHVKDHRARSVQPLEALRFQHLLGLVVQSQSPVLLLQRMTVDHVALQNVEWIFRLETASVVSGAEEDVVHGLDAVLLDSLSERKFRLVSLKVFLDLENASGIVVTFFANFLLELQLDHLVAGLLLQRVLCGLVEFVQQILGQKLRVLFSRPQSLGIFLL